MSTNLFQVDAFTGKPFAGNPAAVCMLEGPVEDEWMQNVAAEMNLSETAFLLPRDDGWDLRWFTPTVEVDLCGHATLASAHILWEAGYLDPDEEACFHTRSGLLTAVRKGEWIEMDFPAQPVGQMIESPEGLAEALGAAPVCAYRADWTQLVELESETVLRQIAPDFARMKSGQWGSAIVTAASDAPEYDFVSRFFAPAVGINEDPVTGSAHCILAPFWTKRLAKDHLVGYQASARGGVVKVAMAGERVKISGKAITVLSGELL
ncbi:MAG: PhzF family phenazine biosynthesis protein [Planctomycetota bacterium]